MKAYAPLVRQKSGHHLHNTSRLFQAAFLAVFASLCTLLSGPLYGQAAPVDFMTQYYTDIQAIQRDVTLNITLAGVKKEDYPKFRVAYTISRVVNGKPQSQQSSSTFDKIGKIEFKDISMLIVRVFSLETQETQQTWNAINEHGSAKPGLTDPANPLVIKPQDKAITLNWTFTPEPRIPSDPKVRSSVVGVNFVFGKTQFLAIGLDNKNAAPRDGLFESRAEALKFLENFNNAGLLFSFLDAQTGQIKLEKLKDVSEPAKVRDVELPSRMLVEAVGDGGGLAIAQMTSADNDFKRAIQAPEAADKYAGQITFSAKDMSPYGQRRDSGYSGPIVFGHINKKYIKFVVTSLDVDHDGADQRVRLMLQFQAQSDGSRSISKE